MKSSVWIKQDESSQNREVMREQILVLGCPSDIGVDSDSIDDSGWTNYVVNTDTWCGLRRQTTLALLPKPMPKPMENPIPEHRTEIADQGEDAVLAPCFGDAVEATPLEETANGNMGLDNGVWAAEWDGVFGYDQELWMPEISPPIRIRACPTLRFDDITDGTSNTVQFSEIVTGSGRDKRYLEVSDPGRGDCFGGPWLRTSIASTPEAWTRVRASWTPASHQILTSDPTLRRDAPTPLWKQQGSHWSIG